MQQVPLIVLGCEGRDEQDRRPVEEQQDREDVPTLDLGRRKVAVEEITAEQDAAQANQQNRDQASSVGIAKQLLPTSGCRAEDLLDGEEVIAHE